MLNLEPSISLFHSLVATVKLFVPGLLPRAGPVEVKE
jgi:hypothetical protein